jgi:hypothetical protein
MASAMLSNSVATAGLFLLVAQQSHPATLLTAAAVLCRYADVQFTSHPAKYIKYAVSDVASIIDDDLFETKAVSMSKLSLTKEKLGAIG